MIGKDEFGHVVLSIDSFCLHLSESESQLILTVTILVFSFNPLSAKQKLQQTTL